MAKDKGNSKQQLLALLAVAVVFIAAAYFIFSSEYSSTGNAVANPIVKNGMTGYAVDENSPEYFPPYAQNSNLGLDGYPAASLIFPYYYSSSDYNADTVFSIINMANETIRVHLFFILGSSCSEANAYITLSPYDKEVFNASERLPDETGFLMAFVVDEQGNFINKNVLIGSARLWSDATQAIQQPYTGEYHAFGFKGIGTTGRTLQTKFDDVNYEKWPNIAIVPSINSPSTHIDSIVLVSPNTVGSIFGLLYDDQEKPYSIQTTQTTCQFIKKISTDSGFPRTATPLTTIIPSGRTGWMELSSADRGIIGLQFKYNNNNDYMLGVEQLYGACSVNCPVTEISLETGGAQ